MASLRIGLHAIPSHENAGQVLYKFLVVWSAADDIEMFRLSLMNHGKLAEGDVGPIGVMGQRGRKFKILNTSFLIEIRTNKLKFQIHEFFDLPYLSPFIPIHNIFILVFNVMISTSNQNQFSQ
jgi:hypothetical protein